MKELREIITKVDESYLNQQQVVLATVVKTEGSSYRKAGARMVVTETHEVAGAVSGGCIEKEVIRRAEEVFQTRQPVLMEYDGRYRLGCAGTLFIFIEWIDLTNWPLFRRAFDQSHQKRESIQLSTSFEGPAKSLGTIIRLQNFTFHLNGSTEEVDMEAKATFDEVVRPSIQLFVIGAEHDSLVLARMAHNLGWDVVFVSHPQNPIRNPDDPFPFEDIAPEALQQEISPDSQTVVVLMTHSFSRDLLYLASLLRIDEIPYLGILGAQNRKEELFNALMDQGYDFSQLDPTRIYAPVGLDIGAELPEEIALAILSEILLVFKGQSTGRHLREKEATVYEDSIVDLE